MRPTGWYFSMCTRIALASHSSSRMWKRRPSPITSWRSSLTLITCQVLHSIVHGACQRLVGEVDHELAGAFDVRPGVLDAPVRPAVEGEHAKRRVLGEDVEEAEGRRVARAGRTQGRHPGDGARQHEGREDLVAVVMVHVGDGVLHLKVPQLLGSTFTPVR